jgi:polyisoprenoid-binding protein YceI
VKSGLIKWVAIIAPGLWLLNPVSGQPPVAQAPARTYTLLAAQSQVRVIAYQEGLVGRLRPQHTIAVQSFSGRVLLPSTQESQVSLEIEAEAKSLAVTDKDMSELERAEFQKKMHEAVLEVARFPKIKFQSVSVTDIKPSDEGHSFTLNGDLTLHGVTKRLAVPVTVVILPDQLRATGEATLKQSDFDIEPYSAGLGLIKIRDAVKVSFTIVAKAS